MVDPVSLAIQVAITAVSMAVTASSHHEGPRLDNLKFTGGDYGSPLPMLWGMRRLEVPIFWAEELKEVKRRRKTKGGKFNEYTYFGTWAVALAGHEISAVRRIWFDTHLVYDISGAGPVTPFDFGGTGDIDDFIAIYLGTETQEPDPRMQATVEALHGEGSCPAYRGTAYICFKDVPLEKLGNRIPQVSVEVLSVHSDTWPWQEIDTSEGGDQLYFSPDFATLYSGGYTGMAIIDTAAAQAINEFSGSFSGTGNRFAVMDDGNFIALAGGTDYPYLWDVYGAQAGSPLVSISMRNLTSAVDEKGDFHWLTKARDTTHWYFDGLDQGTGRFSNHSFADLDGNVWAVSYDGSSTTSVDFVKVYTAAGAVSGFTVTGLASGGLTGAGVHYRDATTDRFVFSHGGNLYAVDTATGAILDTYTAAHGEPVFENIRPGFKTIWAGFYEINLADFSLVRSLQPSTHWGPSVSITTSVSYDPINHALWNYGTSGPRVYYLDRVAPQTVKLRDIEGDVADWCDIAAYDFALHDQDINGWSATQGQASNIIEPLQSLYDCTMRPHDFTIQGIKYTGTSGGTILTEKFAVDGPRYSVKVRQAPELPMAVAVNFADIEADQQPNNVRVARPLDATGARGEQTLDMTTLALNVDDARDLVERYHRRVWSERREPSLSLTAQELKLEPGDCRTLNLDGESATYRCAKLTIKANDILGTEWKYDHAGLATLAGGTGAGFDGRNEATIAVPLLSRGFVLDIPYLTDSDAQTPPIVYALASPFASGTWPGATIYQETGGEFTDELASVASSDQASWGYVTEVMSYANPNVWDRGTSLTVTMQNGTLSGCTEAAVDADPMLNLAAIGANGRWELVNFTTATLIAANTYTVSGFKRGRRGTEWAAELHAARDAFLVLDTAQDTAMGLSEVGTEVAFEAITTGRTTGFPFRYDYQGQSLMPYAPCQLEAEKDSGSGDWTLSWVRRTRVGGAWTSGTTIPLSEASESYEVEIMNGASVVRTITGLSSATATWTAAQQTTDFGSGQSSVTFRVYQISDAVDRGFAAEATV